MNNGEQGTGNWQTGGEAVGFQGLENEAFRGGENFVFGNGENADLGGVEGVRTGNSENVDLGERSVPGLGEISDGEGRAEFSYGNFATQTGLSTEKHVTHVEDVLPEFQERMKEVGEIPNLRQRTVEAYKMSEEAVRFFPDRAGYLGGDK